MKSILFICSGNTCRSSMAEALFKHILEREGLASRYNVSSAGTSAFPGMPASYNAIEALRQIGIDLSFHSSSAVTKEAVDNAELILTMTANHKKYLQQRYAEAAGKIFTLKEYAEGKDGDIEDPFGGDIDTYICCRDKLMDTLNNLVAKLKSKGDI